MAGRTPYTVSGRILDTDGSTALADVSVIIIDVTLNEQISGITDSSGDFVLDLANLTSEYSDGDKLQLCAQTRNKSTWYRHTVDTSVGIWDVGNIPLHIGQHHLGGKIRLFSYVVANHTSSAGQVDFYDVTNDERLLSVECAANATNSGYLAHGLKFDGGICVIRETTTATDWEVTLVAG